MRTTLSIDDDVLAAARERARRESRSVGDVISALAREALTGRHHDAGAAEAFHGFEPFPHRGPSVSNALVDELRDEDAD